MGRSQNSQNRAERDGGRVETLEGRCAWRVHMNRDKHAMDWTYMEPAPPSPPLAKAHRKPMPRMRRLHCTRPESRFPVSRCNQPYRVRTETHDWWVHAGQRNTVARIVVRCPPSTNKNKKKRFSFQGGNYNAITTARAERGDGIPQTESPPTVALAVYYVLRRNAPKLGSYYTTACVRAYYHQ